MRDSLPKWFLCCSLILLLGFASCSAIGVGGTSDGRVSEFNDSFKPPGDGLAGVQVKSQSKGGYAEQVSRVIELPIGIPLSDAEGLLARANRVQAVNKSAAGVGGRPTQGGIVLDSFDPTKGKIGGS